MAGSTIRITAASFLALALVGRFASGSDVPAADRFRDQVQPVLENYCYGCHGYGASEGGRTLDEFASDEALVGNRELWSAVLKNVRAHVMPPADEERPTTDEWQAVEGWVLTDVFGIDPDNPDPGRVTLRRLNRTEYRNTIRDLMDVDFKAFEEFPPDDTGYGFDNIGDVLSTSPLLLEKYLQAAERIVAEAVPTVSKVVAEETILGSQFRSEDGSQNGGSMTFYDAAEVAHAFRAPHDGAYRLLVEVFIEGHYEFDPGRCRVNLKVDGDAMFDDEFAWEDGKTRRWDYKFNWKAGEHSIAWQLAPLVERQKETKFLDFRIVSVRVEGPLDDQHWVLPANYERFFPDGPPPADPTDRDQYAREILRQFATRAYRRPVDDETLDRLASLAKDIYSKPESTFESGVARAMVAILASPRFLFRLEQLEPAPDGTEYPLVDEYALASRLSYFLWSTMPNEELVRLADSGQLRAQLPDQVKRMLADGRSSALVENFAGQWLQSRDVENIIIDPVPVLGLEKEREELRRYFRRNEPLTLSEIEESVEPPVPPPGTIRPPEPAAELELDRKAVGLRLRRFGELRREFSGDLRKAMRRETEMCFEHVMREDRSLLELIDSDYTFLNERLARHYVIDGVKGDEMRRVSLPKGSPRGGVLTQGTMLIVTSNSTRTSPVKRGLYVLDNLLGTPPPPPLPSVPPLEKTVEAITDHEPTGREAIELHRADPACAACHARMDPLGLALENFNALGMWRDEEHGQRIDASGQLVSGQEFQGVRDLKKILKNEYRLNFYRCVTEKMLTYALGRGLEYYDEYTVDRIVERLEENDGHFSALVMGIVDSVPFQKQRGNSDADGDRQARSEMERSLE